MTMIETKGRMLTILTATYNRGYALPLLYESLRNQDCKEFEWLIVDDGSNDNSRELIKNWCETEKSFKIRFFHKENGGKHRAINFAVPKIVTPYTFIVDSDDRLTKDAVKEAIRWIKTIDADSSFAGVAGLRGYSKDNRIGEFPSNRGKRLYIDSTNIERRKNHLTGDKAEIYRTRLLRQFPFPEIVGEKFITESVVWNEIAGMGYKIRWFNKVIYIGDYLEDGLTKNMRQIRLDNFRGYTLEVNQALRLEGFFYKYRVLGRYCLLAKEKKMNMRKICDLLSLSNLQYYIGISLSVLQKIKNSLDAFLCGGGNR